MFRGASVISKVKKTFTIEFSDTKNPMIKNCINMITSGVQDRLIFSSDEKVVLDASHVSTDKLLQLSNIFSETRFVKKVSLEEAKV
jgi:hypothetical protein